MVQWPPHSKITCFSCDGEIIATSKRSRLDLADSLMLSYYGNEPLACEIEVSTRASDWNSWNTENVKKIESYIRFDLGFDGYKVKINRISRPGKTLCTNHFKWGLEISTDYGDEDQESDSTKRYVGSRFKVARSDASIKTIQANIEKVFGLPRGCVCLLTPEDKKANPRSSIKRLRSKWKIG